MKLYNSVGPNPHVVRMYAAECGVELDLEAEVVAQRLVLEGARLGERFVQRRARQAVLVRDEQVVWDPIRTEI